MACAKSLQSARLNNRFIRTAKELAIWSWKRSTRDGRDALYELRHSVQLFQAALETDPNYAAAHLAYWRLIFDGRSSPTPATTK